jgi:hypothetical protein
MLRDVETVHHGHTPEIELTSATTASGIWAMEDRLRWPPLEDPSMQMNGFGHYHDTYDKTDGEWRISSSTLKRLRVDIS